MKKLNNKKGFTLAELLIVVAIIGVLTVVAVPVFTTQLEKSREATDIANLREAKAAAAAAYLENDQLTGDKYFDVSSGSLVDTAPSSAYGKGTARTGDPNNTQYGYKPGTNGTGTSIDDGVYTNAVIKVTFTPGSNPTVAFAPLSSGND